MFYIFFLFWCFLLGCLLLLVGAIYAWFKHSYTYWEKRGIYGPKPSFPAGNVPEILRRKLHMGEIVQKIYMENRSHPYVGIYFFCRKILLVNDLQMVKNIMVKNFSHFTDHGLQFSQSEVLSQHLFNFNGAKWKNVRNTLTPAFTSSKMKYMFETIASCGEELEEYLAGEAAAEQEVNVKEIAAKFTTDVIVSCAMGLDSNSFKKPDAEFRKIGFKIFDLSLAKSIIQSMVILAPKLLGLLDLTFLDKEVNDFFTNVVRDTVDYREKNGITRNDLMHLLIKLKNNESIKDDQSDENETPKDDEEKPSLTMKELTAQVFGFFLGGFETSSTMSSYILHELARDRAIQDKLREEIDRVLAKHDGRITYEAVGQMDYLTMVIKEGLRKYPTIPNLVRVCTKQFQMPDSDAIIEKGTQVMIPVLGIQRDPKIYPDPLKFDPQRFAPENATEVNNFSFLAFGEGPRICIGNRFAMLQMRIALISILRKYEVFPVKEPVEPLQIDIRTFIYAPKDGVTLRIKNRAK